MRFIELAEVLRVGGPNGVRTTLYSAWPAGWKPQRMAYINRSATTRSSHSCSCCTFVDAVRDRAAAAWLPRVAPVLVAIRFRIDDVRGAYVAALGSLSSYRYSTYRHTLTPHAPVIYEVRGADVNQSQTVKASRLYTYCITLTHRRGVQLDILGLHCGLGARTTEPSAAHRCGCGRADATTEQTNLNKPSRASPRARRRRVASRYIDNVRLRGLRKKKHPKDATTHEPYGTVLCIHRTL